MLMGYLISVPWLKQGLWKKAKELQVQIIETRKRVLGAEAMVEELQSNTIPRSPHHVFQYSLYVPQ